jgi:hypothetical protein
MEFVALDKEGCTQQEVKDVRQNDKHDVFLPYNNGWNYGL